MSTAGDMRGARLRRLAFAAALLGALWLTQGLARAEVERYAVIIGNNQGHPDDGLLRYAEDDAEKLHQVLKSIGGFRPENMLLLQGDDAEDVRQALILMNERIRRDSGPGRPGAMLLVYYSGHADSQELHLGPSSLKLRQLEALVEGSAAAFRVLILDACRSGVLTRAKGGRTAAPIAVSLGQRFAGEGTVLLTASAANEDAQESDAVKGSFFTHYLVSGLLGAADEDGDGRVVLEEAYRYAYDHTLRASSRTLAGTQHPTFRYDLRGQGQVVLTSVVPASHRAIVTVPPGRSYLFFRGDAGGPVVAEIGAFDKVRRISIPAGRYFVRGRAQAFLLEGTVVIEGGGERAIADNELERSEYARLVRKGGADITAVHGLQAGMRGRSALFTASGCLGAYLSYTWETRHVDLVPRLLWCQGLGSGESVSSGEGTVMTEAPGSELAAELALAKAWDTRLFTVDAGVLSGVAAIRDAGIVRNSALGKDRRLTALVGAALGISRDLAHGLYARMDLGMQIYFQNKLTAVQGSSGNAPQEVSEGLDSDTAVRWSIGMGKRW